MLSLRVYHKPLNADHFSPLEPPMSNELKQKPSTDGAGGAPVRQTRRRSVLKQQAEANNAQSKDLALEEVAAGAGATTTDPAAKKALNEAPEAAAKAKERIGSVAAVLRQTVETITTIDPKNPGLAKQLEGKFTHGLAGEVEGFDEVKAHDEKLLDARLSQAASGDAEAARGAIGVSNHMLDFSGSFAKQYGTGLYRHAKELLKSAPEAGGTARRMLDHAGSFQAHSGPLHFVEPPDTASEDASMAELAASVADAGLNVGKVITRLTEGWEKTKDAFTYGTKAMGDVARGIGIAGGALAAVGGIATMLSGIFQFMRGRKQKAELQALGVSVDDASLKELVEQAQAGAEWEQEQGVGNAVFGGAGAGMGIWLIIAGATAATGPLAGIVGLGLSIMGASWAAYKAYTAWKKEKSAVEATAGTWLQDTLAQSSGLTDPSLAAAIGKNRVDALREALGGRRANKHLNPNDLSAAGKTADAPMADGAKDADEVEYLNMIVRGSGMDAIAGPDTKSVEKASGKELDVKVLQWIDATAHNWKDSATRDEAGDVIGKASVMAIEASAPARDAELADHVWSSLSLDGKQIKKEEQPKRDGIGGLWDSIKSGASAVVKGVKSLIGVPPEENYKRIRNYFASSVLGSAAASVGGFLSAAKKKLFGGPKTWDLITDFVARKVESDRFDKAGELVAGLRSPDLKVRAQTEAVLESMGLNMPATESQLDKGDQSGHEGAINMVASVLKKMFVNKKPAKQ